jgi:hypothetical protein
VSQDGLLPLTEIAELDIAAASGLVALGEHLCVIADDELFLSLYRRDGTPARRVPLWHGELPEPPAERKRHKPDLEAIAKLEDGRLLVLGSGSRAQRMRGTLVDPARDFAVQPLDLSPLLSALTTSIRELNIEGAACVGDRLWLLQRGNGRDAFNAVIELDLAALLGSCVRESCVRADCMRTVHAVDLASIDGVVYGFTDATPHPQGGVLFSAVAEASFSTYDDGRCLASAIGWLDASARLRSLQRVTPDYKLEGIALIEEPGRPSLLRLVCDPDDRAQRARLLSAEWPLDA